MPISFFPAKHGANPLPKSPTPASNTPASFLKSACGETGNKAGEILQSSFASKKISDAVLPTSNGLVDTIIKAYGGHHALVLRPDDVWLCILTQFSFYVDANAESLRSIFVAHEGKKELTVTAVGTRYTVDFGHMARTMTERLRENINDPSVVDWITPKFSTTTLNDVVVSSVLMMATMKHYFSYTFRIICGIPKVTLEGEKSDWQELLRRIERLKEYGEEPTRWYGLLHPILSQFVKAFDNPDGKENIEFWDGVVIRPKTNLCGGPDLSGWITAFCVWTNHGKWMGPRAVPSSHAYHEIHTSDIPMGYAEVDVKVDDNGALFQTIMVSGLVGMQVCDSNDKTLSPEGLRDTIKPAPGWWIFIQRDDYITPEEEMRQLMKKLEEDFPLIPKQNLVQHQPDVAPIVINVLGPTMQ
ncbi:hypothetical protein BDP27DRAFT_1361330 [Rhodocollybia butyracea]|uniref:Uncharacterized protein n=1 Tax=Rhodocollybia butyracea TaxID=206335 RepID=A0A9P5PY81_9AGAR|nr:hypothetical protein BDP27DRAFT_1361330 [Rhodocollybia butyracea]